MVIIVNEINHSLLLAIFCVVVIVIAISAVWPRDHDDDVDAQPEIFLVRVLYMQAPAGRRMNDFIEQRYEGQFANGQSCRDLGVSLGLTQPGFQLMEAIHSISDFFRAVRISAREIALNHRSHSKMDASIREQADAEQDKSAWTMELELRPLKNIFDAAVEQRTELHRGSVVLLMSCAGIPKGFRESPK